MGATIQAYLENLGSGAGYFILLLASGFVFVCMVVLSFAGGGDSDGADADAGGDLDSMDHVDAPDSADTADSHDSHQGLLKYLSFRNCVNYLLGFSFCGFLATRTGAHPFIGAMLALSGGFVSAILMYKLMAALYSLADSQPLRMRDAIGETARVYIQVGPGRSSRGKVLLNVKGAQREFAAVTDHDEALKATSTVRVTDLVDDCYVVAPLHGPAEEMADPETSGRN